MKDSVNGVFLDPGDMQTYLTPAFNNLSTMSFDTDMLVT